MQKGKYDSLGLGLMSRKIFLFLFNLVYFKFDAMCVLIFYCTVFVQMILVTCGCLLLETDLIIQLMDRL